MACLAQRKRRQAAAFLCYRVQMERGLAPGNPQKERRKLRCARVPVPICSIAAVSRHSVHSKVH